MYKLHVKFPSKNITFNYNPHTSELTQFDGKSLSLASIQKDYEPKHFKVWEANSPSNPAKKRSDARVIKIQMGLKCNYACSYCNQASQVPNSLQGNPKEAQAFLDNLDNWYTGDGNKTRWEFWGGEPFVYWKVLKILAEGLRKRFPKAEFNIISNGSLLTKERVDWIDKLDIQLGISHDGTVYEKQRGKDVLDVPESLEAIKYAYEKLFPKQKIGFNCVLTVHNYSYKAVREHIASKLGISHFDVPLTSEEIMLPYDTMGMILCPTEPHEQKEMRETLFGEIFSGDSLFVSAVFDKLDDWFQSLAQKRPWTAMGQKCGMDNPDNISLDLKGNTMTCQNTNANLKEHNTGNINNIEAVEMKLVHHFRTRDECSKCPVVQMCKGACLFLENNYWKKACDVSYHYNLALLASGIHRLTGGILTHVEGTPRREGLPEMQEVISMDFIKEQTRINNGQEPVAV